MENIYYVLLLLFSPFVMSDSDFMNCSMPDSHILHCRPEFAQIHVS